MRTGIIVKNGKPSDVMPYAQAVEAFRDIRANGGTAELWSSSQGLVKRCTGSPVQEDKPKARKAKED